MIEINVRKKLNFAAGPGNLQIELPIAEEKRSIALTGESGCGKTTLLRMIAGLTTPDEGYIKIGDKVCFDSENGINLPPQERNIGMVFQSFALFPNMTAWENIMYACGDKQHAEFLLDLVHMSNLRDAYPHRLSGGQKQRLALIRAISRKPSLLLLDEPLSAVDAAMRRKLQQELLKVRELYDMTMILVSHDENEVIRLADRLIFIRDGKVIFDDKPTIENLNSLHS